MNFSIVTLESFDKEAKKLKKKYPSFRQDYLCLIKQLLADPNRGVDLGKGLRKIRMAIHSKGKGKSHGARVITFTIIINTDESEINLLYIYDKAERDSISIQEMETLLKKYGF